MTESIASAIEAQVGSSAKLKKCDKQIWSNLCADSVSDSRNVVSAVLVVNRGECALRVFRTCVEMGLSTVGLQTKDDEFSLHKTKCGTAYEIKDYTDIDGIIAVCQRHVSQMDKNNQKLGIHPGYGFLSENPEFARRINEENNLVWIGPSPDIMDMFAMKDTARKLARQHNVPLVEGSGILKSVNEAKQWFLDTDKNFQTFGFPVIMKPVGGGGGIGMRKIYSMEELEDEQLFRQSQDLASRFFGNGDVYCEKFVEQGRHIEVQVFGDGCGNVIHLGERECSVQRRSQKVIEETPSVGISYALRKKICETAVQFCEKIKYESAGTVEFILDDVTGKFYFLEVNTRIQVEHGVTELVNEGLDLVKWMIIQACSRQQTNQQFSNYLKDYEWAPSGSAIQVRVYAEDVFHDFRPCPGLIQEFQLPQPLAKPKAKDIETEQTQQREIQRFETHAYRGYTVPAKYDPMIVKILQWAPNREECIEKLSQTLDNEVRVQGAPNNLPLIKETLKARWFTCGQTFTNTLEEFVKTDFAPSSFEVLKPCMSMAIQDYPGRTKQGLWRIGVPPSGAFDHLSCRLANSLVGNSEDQAVIECLMVGQKGFKLKFNAPSSVVAIAGVSCDICKISSKSSENESRDNDNDIKLNLSKPKFQYYNSYESFIVKKGEILEVVRSTDNINTNSTGQSGQSGCRAYVAIQGGIDVPKYLGSRSTFVNGEFGGYRGRLLRTGDILPIGKQKYRSESQNKRALQLSLQPSQQFSKNWTIGVLPGPRGSPDYMTEEDTKMLHSTKWEVHHNSNRLGIRLNGPKPNWARKNGGEGGNHPSNIHDEEYAVGTINFTGDMPVIITHDGPSLGGFVCPITIVQAHLWKVGQVQAGDTIQFKLMTLEEALFEKIVQAEFVRTLRMPSTDELELILKKSQSYQKIVSSEDLPRTQAVLMDVEASSASDNIGSQSDSDDKKKNKSISNQHMHIHPGMKVRLAGDKYVLIEYGEMKLDLALRVRVHYLEKALLSLNQLGLEETAPGVRTLQVRYDPLQLPLPQLLNIIEKADRQLNNQYINKNTSVSNKLSLKFPNIQTRVFYLPMAFDSKGCADAMDKYSKSIRDDAPYLPCNIDYVAKNNGLNLNGSNLERKNEVKEKVFRASYMCLGLGDVYLGACCAIPINPMDRMTTTKMNPARTWTEEGTVGLGGAYMCIYPMYSPGGYQLVGRTLPIWNTYCSSQKHIFTENNNSSEKDSSDCDDDDIKPWMLEMFDQIRFYEVTEPELDEMRAGFKNGSYTPKMEFEDFDLEQHQKFLEENKDEIEQYQEQQRKAAEAMNEVEEASQKRILAKSEAELAEKKKIGKSQLQANKSAEEIGGGGYGVAGAINHLTRSGENGNANFVELEADVTSNVWEIRKKVGDRVKNGETILVLEAMKMEIPIVYNYNATSTSTPVLAAHPSGDGAAGSLGLFMMGVLFFSFEFWG